MLDSVYCILLFCFNLPSFSSNMCENYIHLLHTLEITGWILTNGRKKIDDAIAYDVISTA